MRFLLVVAAAALMAPSIGCQAMKSNKCGPVPCHVTQSQNAPRPTIFRDTCGPGGCQQAGCLDDFQQKSNGFVNGCVECALDCDASGCGCGCACGPDCGCEPSCGCGQGGCGQGCCGQGCYGQGCGNCSGCQSGGLCQRLAAANGPSMCPCGPGDSAYGFQPGPPVGQTAYPYYTTKGPRDFLMANPPSIGPNGAYGCR